MQKPVLREILPLQRIGRDDDAGFRVEAQKMSQAARVVGMPMRNEHIVHFAEVEAQTVGIAYEEVTGSRVEQYAMACGLQQDAQPVFGFETWIAGAIVGQHRPFEVVQNRMENALEFVFCLKVAYESGNLGLCLVGLLLGGHGSDGTCIGSAPEGAEVAVLSLGTFIDAGRMARD